MHKLTLLTKCWPDAMIKDFLLSDNFLRWDYKDTNHFLLAALNKSTATSPADLALEAERFFRTAQPRF